jgi:VIT1/CCC1 family predicted Fe2+/Mn2+ transporter
VPLLPFVAGAHTALASSIVSLLALFAAGAVSSRFTARTWVFAGSRQLLIGAFAAAVTYGIGSLFHVGGVG